MEYSSPKADFPVFSLKHQIDQFCSKRSGSKSVLKGRILCRPTPIPPLGLKITSHHPFVIQFPHLQDGDTISYSKTERDSCTWWSMQCLEKPQVKCQLSLHLLLNLTSV